MVWRVDTYAWGGVAGVSDLVLSIQTDARVLYELFVVWWTRKRGSVDL